VIDVRPVEQWLAFAVVDEYHSHHRHPAGWLYGLGAYADGDLVGVVTSSGW